MNYFNRSSIIENEYVGLINPRVYPLKTNFLKTYVLQNERYRPDLISFRLFNSVNYSWILDDMNNFFHGFMEYEAGREIFYLKKEDLKDIGIIR